MTTEELRKLTMEEILDKLAELKKALVDIEFQVRINKEKDFSKIKKTKKDIARLLTILNEGKLEKTGKKIKKEKLAENTKDE